jgi:hypothetical protein
VQQQQQQLRLILQQDDASLEWWNNVLTSSSSPIQFPDLDSGDYGVFVVSNSATMSSFSSAEEVIHVSHCFDGVLNAEESDVDCGEACGQVDGGKLCGDNQSCFSGFDCLSGVCSEETSLCVPSSCDDGQLNGEESDVDCGEACGQVDGSKLCGDNQSCFSGFDCLSGCARRRRRCVCPAVVTMASSMGRSQMLTVVALCVRPSVTPIRSATQVMIACQECALATCARKPAAMTAF